MFNFLKTKLKPGNEASFLVEELANQDLHTYPFKLENFTAGLKILNASPQVQRRVALAMITWLKLHRSLNYNAKEWKIHRALFELLKYKIPFSSDDLVVILNWSISQRFNVFRGVPEMIKVCADYLKENTLDDDLCKSIEKLIIAIEGEIQNTERKRWVLRLRELLGGTDVQLPLAGDDAWAARALDDIYSLPPEKLFAWAELLLQCLRVTGSSPSAKWMKATDVYIDAIGRPDFFSALMRWFPLVDHPRERMLNRFDHRETLIPVNADLLKGLVWLSAKSDAPEMARVLSTLAVSGYRKIPHMGPRAAKVGNACFWALANMPGNDGIAQLSILKVRIKGNAAQRVIAKAIQTAANRNGLTASEIEELSVPTYGLGKVGFAKFTLDDAACEIQVNGVDVEQGWQKGGKRIASVPKNIKEHHPDELKEITQAVKDIRKMLPAQRDRIENLYLAQKKWQFTDWRAVTWSILWLGRLPGG